MRHARRTTTLVRAVVLGLAVHVCAQPVTAQARRVPAASDFVDLNELEETHISPDGRWVALVVRSATAPGAPEAEGERGVHLVRADGDGGPVRVAPELGEVASPRWSPSGHLTFVAGGSVYEHVPGSPAWSVRRLTPDTVSVSRYEWSPGGAEIAFLAPVPREDGRPGSTGVWLLDVTTGTPRPLTPPDMTVRDLTWSPDGRALAVLASGGGEPGTTVRVVDRSGAVRTVARHAGGPGSRRQVLDWSRDGVILFSHDAPGRQAGQHLGLVPASGGEVRELLAEYEGILMRAVWAPDGRSILAQTFEGLVSRLIRVDPRTGKVTRLAEILDSYPTFTVAADGRTFAYRGERIEGPADAWVFREGQQPRRITHLNPHLADVVLGSVRPFEWTNAEDGTRLEGVLVLPPDYRPGVRYPTIVQLHGGPHFHWGLGWLGDWHDWAQFLATRGYVVLLPNPRGSTGRGTAFASAIIHDLGGVDFRDVMAGVDALIEGGIADPDRLGVGGWSYGGFLTARTITQTDRFKAAVVGAGISNLLSFASTPGLGPTWTELFFEGTPYTHREAFVSRSPTERLQHVTTPTLVVHGDRDPKISVTQGWELYYGLRWVGVDTDIVIFPGAGHVLTRRQDRLAYLESVLSWFDRYVRPDAGVAAGGDGGR